MPLNSVSNHGLHLELCSVAVLHCLIRRPGHIVIVECPGDGIYSFRKNCMCAARIKANHQGGYGSGRDASLVSYIIPRLSKIRGSELVVDKHHICRCAIARSLVTDHSVRSFAALEHLDVRVRDAVYEYTLAADPVLLIRQCRLV